ncbi:transcriptional regulator GutM [Enterococcus dongliensis]|uniref:Transcriptional regulator GutM n=1 Tax=Enterococcus dongliensis TaxID=2559925 RepID=A0ABU3ET84_9ENTE|nr:transcriptional regulator GutM [Enterococcus dongliensis]MDT2597543.1 transcriptional regulator GutM [Enterococcus dongliensis]MDT2604738.1 transcriptional regulator GutM [Enterococcus dongliensis]MDT2640331.1 transcriptional regulator GutM [Enterococcus dongliensis]MDT2645823.1 transcriptional regulator GutM [Enterococcus dongliensis]MDT2648402.1 transcriptional regulator GutM [Enterococcus dongliensis]
MRILLIILFFLMVTQSLTSIMQVKYYQKFIRKITEKFDHCSTYELYTDVSKGSLFKTIVAVVIDANGKIINCYACKGLTIFARFRKEEVYHNITLAEIHQKRINQDRVNSIENVLDKIYLRKMEAISDI